MLLCYAAFVMCLNICMMMARPGSKLPGAFFLQPREALARSKKTVLYGVMTCGVADKVKLIEAQLQTWAAQVYAEGRYFAMTGQGDFTLPRDKDAAWMRSPCKDTYDGLACKEFYLEREAFVRNADWLVILGEDNYVNTSLLEAKLEAYDSEHRDVDAPVALGLVGCELRQCPELPNDVSLCGGAGIMLNRAAVKALFSADADSLRSEYMAKSGQPNDVITACAVQKRGGTLMQFNDGLEANRIMTRSSLQAAIAKAPLVLHYITTPALMQWVYATTRGEDVEPEGAFDDDCCCWSLSKEECKER